MKQVYEIKHVVADIFDFEDKVKESVKKMQDEGLLVEISHATRDNHHSYSALIIGYK